MIALLGSNGQVGTALTRLLGEKAVGIGRDAADLSKPAEVTEWISSMRPEAVVNCAAYTRVDQAETDPEEARAINATSVGSLATATARLGIPFVTFSTDYVFDGTKDGPYLEHDLPNPLSVYGRTKLEGEALALRQGVQTLVVRTSWVLSGTHPNFARAIIDKARQGAPLQVVDDQHGRPTVASDLARAVVDCLDRGSTGVLHLTNAGDTTWFELARQVLALAGLDPDLVEPVPSSRFPRPAQRPANSVLGSERLGALGVEPLPHHSESLPEVVARLVEAGA